MLNRNEVKQHEVKAPDAVWEQSVPGPPTVMRSKRKAPIIYLVFALAALSGILAGVWLAYSPVLRAAQTTTPGASEEATKPANAPETEINATVPPPHHRAA
ncbi:MAG: hypothetical protein WKF84_03470 [Pyrinomonadaceae bacterium]